MKNVKLMTSLLVAGLFGLTGCQPEKKEKETATVTVSQKMAADELTAAGEQLIGPFTFHLADKTFEMALEKNPDDKKAQFYRKLLKRFMVYRGILTRVKPFAQSHGNAKGLEATVKNMPKHPLRSFLMDAKDQEPITDAVSMQKFLDSYQAAVNEFREYALENQELELDLYMNPSVFKDRIDENASNSCRLEPGTDGSEFSVTCNLEDLATIKINIADMIALRQEAAGEVLYFSLFTAYSVEGIEELMKDVSASNNQICTGGGGHWDSQRNEWVSIPYECRREGRYVSTKEAYERLAALPGAGKLRAENSLRLIKTLGADFSRAAKWVMEHQKSLCPGSSPSVEFGGSVGPKKRPGFLFSQGLCVEKMDEGQRQLALFDKMLAGVTRMDVEAADGEKFETDVNVFALFDNPVKDLRKLLPTSWSDCGEAATLPEQTFGGVYPNGDAERIMIKRCK